jgi:hypothetical protein
MYIQQNAKLHGSFYLETALHISGETSTHHQERKQLYLQHLVIVTPYCCLLLSWKSGNGFKCAVDGVRLSVSAPNDGWCYHSKYVEQFSDKINCVTLHLVGYILEYSYNVRSHER